MLKVLELTLVCCAPDGEVRRFLGCEVQSRLMTREGS